MDQVGDEFLADGRQPARLGDVDQEEDSLAWVRPRHKVRLHGAFPMDQLCLCLCLIAGEDLEQPRLERHLDHACGQARGFDVKEVARGLVRSEDPAFHVQEQRNHRRRLERLAERVVRYGLLRNLIFRPSPLPDHGRSI